MKFEKAHKSNVVGGSLLIAAESFDCLLGGETCPVLVDEHGKLFVSCAGPDKGYEAVLRGSRDERHYLEGQLDGDGYYVGFMLAPRREAAE